MFRFVRPLLLLIALSALPGAAQAQMASGSDLKGMLSGNGSAPLTLQMKDLDPSWRHLSAGVVMDSNSTATMYSAMFGGTGNAVYYTKGDTITQGGEMFLVAYRAAQNAKFDFAKLMRGQSADAFPKPQPLTPESALTLTLLNLRSVTSLGDIRPFNLADELADSKKAAADTTSLISENTNAQSASNLKQIGLALTQYTQDSDEVFPPMKSAAQAQKALMPFVRDAAIFVQPETKQPYQTNPLLSGRSLAVVDAAAETVAYFEAAPDSDGMRAVLFTDGHVKRISEAEWQQHKNAMFQLNRSAPPPKPRRAG